jgi:hypothetical protein
MKHPISVDYELIGVGNLKRLINPDAKNKKENNFALEESKQTKGICQGVCQ